MIGNWNAGCILMFLLGGLTVGFITFFAWWWGWLEPQDWKWIQIAIASAVVTILGLFVLDWLDDKW